MIRTKAGSNIGGKGTSFEATPLALWTPRNVDTKNGGHNITSRSGPAVGGQLHLPFPAAGRLLHTRRLGGPPAGKAVNSSGDRQVEVLTRLPSLYTKLHSNSQQQQQQQQQQQKQQPEPLPLLHGSKRMQRHKKLQQLKQQTPTDPEEAGDAAPADPDAGRSRFRISVADRLPQEQQSVDSQKQQTQQQQQQQQQPRSVPMAYFSRGSASLHSTLLDDVDSRSCDRRHPDKSAAYSRAAVYIRDNDLMPASKARLIWRWMDELNDATPSAGRLFVYDPTSRWFSMAA